MQNNVGIYASQISGHLWAPNGAYDALATVTVPSGGAASITFAGIPAGYKHLQIRGFAKTTGALWFATTINGDTSTGYASHALYANGSSVSAFGTATGTATYGYTGLIEADGQSALIIDFLDYTDTTKNKTVRSLWGNDRNGAGNIGLNSFFRPGQTGAITSITITAPFQQYSSFALYGVK
jgi:hypothetical protein